ncbi:MAG: SDR family oxidoreductase [Candidatus Aminicenantes bacterium]|nr:SDR family oxidoreductase [Candidatus Aminicenantes bacterium]
MIDTELKDKVVVVTGANHGIGAATAEAFSQQGAAVFIHFWRLPVNLLGSTKEKAEKAVRPGVDYYSRVIMQSAEMVAEKIKKRGGNVFTWETDLSIPDNIPRIFDLAEQNLGDVSIVVNNAAFGNNDTFLPQKALEKSPYFAEEYKIRPLTAATHDEHFSVNSRGTALMMAEFARRHINRGSQWGRIINISTDGARGHAFNVSYGASKNAVESYTRAAAYELGPYGITVNGISPGAVQTGWMPENLEKSLAESYPLRRVGRPEDIADAVVFFASKQADWITGQVLYVGGGNAM